MQRAATSYSASGFVLDANDEYGQEGTPLLVDSSAIAFTPFGPRVETGITYQASSDIFSRASP